MQIGRQITNAPGLLPPQTEGEYASQKAHPPRSGQFHASLRQSVLSPPEMIRPSRFVQRLRVRGQRQVKLLEQLHLQPPPAHTGPGPVNPAASRVSAGSQLPPLGHQSSGRAKGVGLVGLFFQGRWPRA